MQAPGSAGRNRSDRPRHRRRRRREIVAEGDTDAAGNASLSVYNTADPGSKTYTVSYSGGAAVDASTSQFAVQTTQTNVDIAISWTDDLLPGGDAVITADIIGTPQSPSGNATISYDGNQIAGGADRRERQDQRHRDGRHRRRPPDPGQLRR